MPYPSFSILFSLWSGGAAYLFSQPLVTGRCKIDEVKWETAGDEQTHTMFVIPLSHIGRAVLFALGYLCRGHSSGHAVSPLRLQLQHAICDLRSGSPTSGKVKVLFTYYTTVLQNR